MYKNETVLTPLFRYLIWCIDSQSEDWKASAKLLEEIKQKENIDKSSVNRTLELLSLCSVDKEQAIQFWKARLVEIEDIKCNRCLQCKKCQSYYWRELAELLFSQPNTMKEKGIYFPIRRIPEKIAKHLVRTKSATDLYYHNYCRNRGRIRDGCIILKGMSSSTPSLMNSVYDTSYYSGGGIYLRHHGIGVAIDPGYHFLDNLHHYGLSVMDIDVVVITHEHIDHNNDMRLLDDLHQAVYSYGEKKNKLRWYLDGVSYQVANVYQRNETGFLAQSNELYEVCGEDDEIWLDKVHEFKMRLFPTRHIQPKNNRATYKNHTFGCQFYLTHEKETKSMLYTSDTSYFDKLSCEIGYPDFLVANISGIYEDDFMLVKPKERHLGYYGCYYLLMDIWKRFEKVPSMVFLSEFWNGENDIRFDVASFLQEQISQKVGTDKCRIVPAEIGMAFDLFEGTIRCSHCGEYVRKFILSKPKGYENKIKVLCSDCFY